MEPRRTRVTGCAFRRNEAEKSHQLLRGRKATYIANGGVESAMGRGQACHADSGGGSSTHRTGLTTIGDATGGPIAVRNGGHPDLRG